MAREDRTHEVSDRSSTPTSSTEQQAQMATRLAIPQSVQRAFADPSFLTPADVQRLQRTIGNRATVGLLSRSTGLQARLTLGPAGDQYEQEADRVAQQVVRQMDRPQPAPLTYEGDVAQAKPAPYDSSTLQRQGTLHQQPNTLAAGISRVQRTPAPQPRRKLVLQRHEHEEDEEELAQMKPMHGPEGGQVDQSVERQIQAARSGGKPLDDGVRSSMERGFGADFSNVRVHTGTQADTLNRSLQARAFTVGSNIFFKNGEYNPGNSGGKELLAHELTHTVQQGAAPAVQTKVQRHSTHDKACSCSSCSGVRRMLDGTPLQRHHEEEDLQRMPVQRSSGQHGAACKCSSCAGIQRKSLPHLQRQRLQRHEEEELQMKPAAGRSGTVQRATQAHGSACGCGSCRTPRIQAKLQRAAAPVAASVAQSTHAGRIQRHSSWEHQLLGDMAPDDLAKIGTWQNLIENGKQVDDADVDVLGVGTIKKGNVMHVLAQELQRLALWQQNPPQGTSDDDRKKLDPTWQVVLVSLPAAKFEDKLVITYGELNTLADYYGDLDTMKTANPKQRKQLVQSVRQETFFRLKDIYEKLQKSLSDTEKLDQDVIDAEAMMADNSLVNQKLGFKFKGAMTPDYISGLAGQVNLLAGDKPLIGQGTGASGDTNKYGATLARNACHFVPESWHAWAGYHKDARAEALNAWNESETARTLQTQHSQLDDSRVLDKSDLSGNIAIAKSKAARFANDALLANGFGDHYLQDSYAAGHMLNKTQIMQWYVEYIDRSKEWDYFKDKNWRKVQQMAYKQPGLASAAQYDKSSVEGVDSNKTANKARNPQTVESMTGGDWQDNFSALGLEVATSLQVAGSNERKLAQWWQSEAMSFFGSRSKTGDNLLSNKALKKQGITGPTLQQALMNLLSDGVVRLDGQSVERRGEWMRDPSKIGLDVTSKDFKKNKFLLREDYVPKNKKKFKQAVKDSEGGDDSAYQRMAASVTYGDYFEFMKSGFIQKATNALHDVFCKGGLEVSSKDSDAVFTVYGDDAMFNADSAVGAKHSGETANMSRQAIQNIISTGQDQGVTTASIVNRLPAYVKPKGFAKTSIEEWHNPTNGPSLKKYCLNEIFPSMSWSITQKFVPGVAGSELGTISRFEKVHGQHAF